MNANQIIEAIKEVADKQYFGEPPANRLAYHVGLLESHLRNYIQTDLIAQEYIKELETQLIAKESKYGNANWKTNRRRFCQSTKGIWASFKDQHEPAFSV